MRSKVLKEIAVAVDLLATGSPERMDFDWGSVYLMGGGKIRIDLKDLYLRGEDDE